MKRSDLEQALKVEKNAQTLMAPWVDLAKKIARELEGGQFSIEDVEFCLDSNLVAYWYYGTGIYSENDYSGTFPLDRLLEEAEKLPGPTFTSLTDTIMQALCEENEDLRAALQPFAFYAKAANLINRDDILTPVLSHGVSSLAVGAFKQAYELAGIRPKLSKGR